MCQEEQGKYNTYVYIIIHVHVRIHAYPQHSHLYIGRTLHIEPSFVYPSCTVLKISLFLFSSVCVDNK